MKGLTGIVIAAILGLLAGALNWFYLSSKARSLETIAFLGVKEGVVIREGTEFQRNHFEVVEIPSKRAGNLKDYAYLYADLPTLEHVRATKSYEGGELVLKEDYRTPPLELKLEPNQVLLTVNVANRSPLIEPGDWIRFAVPATGSGEGEGVELIGPFRVAAIGNRIGSQETFDSYKMQQVQTNQIGIIANMVNGQLEPSARSLLARMQGSGARDVTIVWEGRGDRPG